MEPPVTSEELIRKGFVDASRQKELEEYLGARRDFLGLFGPRSEFTDRIERTFACLGSLQQMLAELADASGCHAEFLEKDIQPLVQILADEKEQSAIKQQIFEFNELVHKIPCPDPLLESWLRHLLS